MHIGCLEEKLMKKKLSTIKWGLGLYLAGVVAALSDAQAFISVV